MIEKERGKEGNVEGDRKKRIECGRKWGRWKWGRQRVRRCRECIKRK